jgi:uncharacterized protein (TIGR00730 family)
MKCVCVFCGSSKGKNNIYVEGAKELGILLADRNLELIYGGGSVGLMGELADAMLARGGRVTGVIPQFLYDWEVGHDGISELIIVHSMHERKQKMAEMSDVFIAMPGGFGTLEEMGEILTWIQLNLLQKPVGILNLNGFYDKFLEQLDHMVNEGFLKISNRDILKVSDNPQDLLDMLRKHKPTLEAKWIDIDKT